MSIRDASETSLGSRRETALTADRVAGSVVDELQHTVATGGASSTRPRRTTARQNVLTSWEPRNNFPRFLVVKKKEGDFFRDSPFLIDRVLMTYIGVVKSVKKIKEGLLVEAQSDNQAKKLLELTSFNEFEVEVTPHSSLNYVKGVVTCRDLLNCTLEEIVEHLSDQGVVAAKRIVVRRDGILQDTASLILTFEKQKLPEKIKAGIHISLPVRPYIPAPLRCFKCQKFGHTSLRCGKNQICVCGLPLHEGTPCQDPIICINCGGEHSVRSRNCPKFKEEAEIQRIKVTQKLSYIEAKRKLQENRGSLSVSYAQAARPASPTLDVKAIVKGLIPEIKKMCEMVMQESQKMLNVKGSSPFLRPHEPIAGSAKCSTSGSVIEHSLSLQAKDKRKRGETSSRSASGISDADDESVLSSQTSQGEGGTKKRKPGWPKGRSRKPVAESQRDEGSDYR